MNRNIFYLSGALAVGFYLMHVLIGGWLWKGYSHLQQPISDLTASGAPHQVFLISLTTIYGLLALFFAVIVFINEGIPHRKVMFWGSLSFIMLHIVSLSYNFFPQDLPGQEISFTGIMHLVVTALIIPFTILTPILLGCGYLKLSSDRKFGVYSIITGIWIFVFGSIAGYFFVNKLPCFGVVERLNIGALQVWMLCLSLRLYNRR